jgi:hypothetical protein
LISEQQSKGKYNVDWSPKDLPSGVYFYRFQSGDFMKVKKLLYLR